MLLRSSLRPRLLPSKLVSKPVGIRTQSSIASSLGGRLARGAATLRRGASFAFYTSLVLGGVGVLAVTGYYVGGELLLPNSEVQIMHRAFALVEKDQTCREMLGTKMKAHGEDVGGRSVLGRPLANRRFIDRFGREHVVMHFHVNGDISSGRVRLELIENKNTVKYEYRYLVVEVPGYSKHYIINNEDRKKRGGFLGFLGVNWGSKRD